MTDERSTDGFDARLTGLVRLYTDGAAARPHDDLAAARLAMSARARRWPPTWTMRRGEIGPRIAGVPWLALGAAVTIAVLIAVAVDRTTPRVETGQPSAVPSVAVPSAAGVAAIPAELLHPWQRPYGVTPDLGRWGSGTLVFRDGALSVVSDLLDLSSTSKVDPATADDLVVAATDGTEGCELGDAGTYHWKVTGSGTVLTLTTSISDGCKVREQALVGDWVRSDMTGPSLPGPTLEAGTYQTTMFDPLGLAPTKDGLSFTVPSGWILGGESQADATLIHPAVPPDRPDTTFVIVMARPTVLARIPDGGSCRDVHDQPGVGTSVEDLLAALAIRRGVVMSEPRSIEVGGHPATVVDLQMAPRWTDTCTDGEASIVGTLLLHVAGSTVGPGSGPTFGLAAGHPFRLVLVDLGEGRTVAIAAFQASDAPGADSQTLPGDDALRVIERFEFRRASGS